MSSFPNSNNHSDFTPKITTVSLITMPPSILFNLYFSQIQLHIWNPKRRHYFSSSLQFTPYHIILHRKRKLLVQSTNNYDGWLLTTIEVSRNSKKRKARILKFINIFNPKKGNTIMLLERKAINKHSSRRGIKKTM